MLNKRIIIIYWLLLLVPAVLLCGFAFRLLSHEQERLNAAALASLKDRITAIAENIQVTVGAVETALTQALFKIAPGRLQETLLAWEAENPLVRNIFIWDEANHLIYPVKGLASTPEEQRFITRYQSLFSGRLAWEYGDDAVSQLNNKDASNGPDFFHQQTLSKSNPEGFRQSVFMDKRNLKSLRDLAQPQQRAQTAPFAEKGVIRLDLAKEEASGWIPWFAENRLFIIGWVQKDKNGPHYGVELELMTLLSRLIADLPRLSLSDSAYALVGGNGQLLHQVGSFPVDIKQKPGLTLPIAPQLPHWQIRVYYHPDGLNLGKGFIYVAGILLAIFFIAIVSGGGLLTYQAHVNMKDALQKTSFVSAVSHELKTPLTSIRMYAELLQSGRVKGADKVSHYLSVIVTESQRLTRLVNNVLDFSRLEEGRKKYRQDKFNLSDLLRELRNIHGIRIQKAGLAILFQTPNQDLWVFSDRDAIEQVILNLLDNAIKYAAGGKEILFILDDMEMDYYELQICDRGPGIPDSHKERIFEKFHRLDDSLTSKQPGSGLGLSIARRILRDLGGDLIYIPRNGGGCCFNVRIKKNGPHKDSNCGR